MKGISKLKLYLLSFSLLLICCYGHANFPSKHDFLTKQTLESFKWEFYNNKSNSIKERGPQYRKKMAHYNIPERLLSTVFRLKKLPVTKKIEDSLFWENGKGEKFFRWVIHPEDRKYVNKIRKVLKRHGYDYSPHYYFEGFLTSSRSIYVIDTIKKMAFSIKTSTTHTGGFWTEDKYVDHIQIKSAMKASTLVSNIEEKRNFKKMILLKEPLGYRVKGVDYAGMIIRDITPLLNNKYYLPGFSALHPSLGKEIAKKNGSDKPHIFWTDHYVKPLAMAMAQFSAYTGLSMTSAHSQQYLIELDKNLKPTGIIVVRDFTDSEITLPFFEMSESSDDRKMARYWAADEKHAKKYLIARLGIFYGTKEPEWIDTPKYKLMAKNYFNIFDKVFGQITGISDVELQKNSTNIRGPNHYSSKSYSPWMKHVWRSGWKTYYKYGDCFRGSLTYSHGRKCEDVIYELQHYPEEYNDYQDVIRMTQEHKKRKKDKWRKVFGGLVEAENPIIDDFIETF